jgi:hypothetical protein
MYLADETLRAAHSRPTNPVTSAAFQTAELDSVVAGRLGGKEQARTMYIVLDRGVRQPLLVAQVAAISLNYPSRWPGQRVPPVWARPQ